MVRPLSHAVACAGPGVAWVSAVIFLGVVLETSPLPALRTNAVLVLRVVALALTSQQRWRKCWRLASRAPQTAIWQPAFSWPSITGVVGGPGLLALSKSAAAERNVSILTTLLRRW